jgi:hypothetical protein
VPSAHTDRVRTFMAGEVCVLVRCSDGIGGLARWRDVPLASRTLGPYSVDFRKHRTAIPCVGFPSLANVTGGIEYILNHLPCMHVLPDIHE